MAELRRAPFFIGDDLALDFLNSVAAPSGREIDWLANGGDLIAWLEQARAVPADIAAHFRKAAGSRALDGVAGEARAAGMVPRICPRSCGTAASRARSARTGAAEYAARARPKFSSDRNRGRRKAK